MSLKKRGISRLINRLGSSCWYTGLNCVIEHDTHPDTFYFPTREHIFPKSRMNMLTHDEFNRRIRVNNVVIACRYVNNAIGNAPAQVKCDLREHLKTVIAEHGDGTGQFTTHNMELIKTSVDSFLDKYRVYKNSLAWEMVNISLNFPPRKDSAFERAIFRLAIVYAKIICVSFVKNELNFVRDMLVGENR
jgi:hypothetical protein